VACTFRIKHQIAILASQDEDEKLISFSRQAVSATQVIRDDLSQCVADFIQIGTSVTDQAINFAGIASAKIIYLEADGPLTIKVNGSIALPLTPKASGKAKLLWEGAFTSLSVSNADPENTVCLAYLFGG
jgi:hypothetical protein